MKIFLFILSLLSIFLISGCDSSLVEQGNMKRLSEEAINDYFDYVKKGNYKEVVNLYADDFFGDTTKDIWEKQMKQIMKKLGPLQSFKIYQAITKEDKNVLYSKFIYTVKYQHFNSVETFVLKKVGSESPKIVNHHINCDALFGEFGAVPQK